MLLLLLSSLFNPLGCNPLLLHCNLMFYQLKNSSNIGIDQHRNNLATVVQMNIHVVNLVLETGRTELRISLYPDGVVLFNINNNEFVFIVS